MESTPPAQSILDTLRTVEFRLGLKGYNVDEVDEYLEKAAVEAEALHEQLRQLSERLRQASERIGQLEGERREAPAPVEAPGTSLEVVSDDTLQRTLLLAQRFVDQTKRESEAEAAKVVAQAEDRARTTLAQAEDEARRRSNDAEQRLREEVARLESLRGQLAGDVETMARHLESERNRIRGALTEVLKWVDENVQPGSGSSGPPRVRGAAGAVEAPRPAVGAPPPPVGSSGPAGGPDGGPGARPPAPRLATPGGAPAPGADDTGPGEGEVAQVLDLRGAASGSPPADRS
ncbi:MAG TPA: DivIVA domain-containing protein [Acidimicrobiales bacterium]|jgi:cell division initiation protein